MKRDSQSQKVDLLIGRGLITAESIAAELRSRMVNRLAKQRVHFSAAQLLDLARNILAEFEPMLAQTLYDSEVAAWVTGVDYVAQKLPLWAEQEIAELSGGLFGESSGRKPPSKITTIFYPPGGDEPMVRFPLIERAANSLAKRKIVTREQFEQLSAEAKSQAFTVTGIDSADALAKIRDTLAELVAEGPSLRLFRERLAESIETSAIGPGRLETVYRTNVATAFAQGHDELAQNPVVAALFRYQQYLPIRDSRCRPEHLALGSLGIDGTGIYRTDDPFWSLFSPPWDFQCLLPGTKVQGRIEMVMRSRYSGDAVEMVTRSGKRLRVTINHPVLTPYGFVAAGSLRKGDNVFGHGRGEKVRRSTDDAVFCSRSTLSADNAGRFPPDVNVQNAPASVEQVFASLAIKQQPFQMPIGPDDLHGEAAGGQGYIDIVGPDSQLRDWFHSASNQQIDQLTLAHANSPAARHLAGNRNRCLGFFGDGAALARTPRAGALLNDGRPVFFQPRPLQQLRIGSAAHIDASRFQTICDYGSVDPQSLAESQDRIAANVRGHEGLCIDRDPWAADLTNGLLLAEPAQLYSGTREDAFKARVADAEFLGQLAESASGRISLDEIIEIRQFKWSGHVYDLQTEGDWLVGGGIILANCRCGINLMTIEAAARKGVREAQEWQRTGIEPPLESRLPYIPFRPKPGFGQRPRLAAA